MGFFLCCPLHPPSRENFASKFKRNFLWMFGTPTVSSICNDNPVVLGRNHVFSDIHLSWRKKPRPYMDTKSPCHEGTQPEGLMPNTRIPLLLLFCTDHARCCLTCVIKRDTLHHWDREIPPRGQDSQFRTGLSRVLDSGSCPRSGISLISHEWIMMDHFCYILPKV
jgi:hypothetical protein